MSDPLTVAASRESAADQVETLEEKHVEIRGSLTNCRYKLKTNLQVDLWKVGTRAAHKVWQWNGADELESGYHSFAQILLPNVSGLTIKDGGKKEDGASCRD